MRWFWGLLALAVVATAVLLVVRRGPAPANTPPAREPAAASARMPAAPPTPATTTPESGAAVAKPDSPVGLPPTPPTPPVPQTEAVRPVASPPAASGSPIKPIDPVAAASTIPNEVPSTGKPIPAPPAGTPSSERPDTQHPAASPTKPAPSAKPSAPASTSAPAAPSTTVDPKQLVGPPSPSPADAAALALKQGLDDVLGLAEPGATKHDGSPSSTDASIPASSSPAGGATAAAASAKAKLTPREDGTTLVDDRFVMKGAGTHDDPYVITWEMLVSAQETYQPRLGRKIIPDRLKMVDGKWIRIAGFIAFPIMAQSQDEMLMMLNQWDGCCIGVPPTPYDAIEVKLKTPAKGDDRLRVSGSVTGILRVDPYLVKDWLVSLYLMDDAELKIESSGGKRDPVAMPGHKPPQ